MKNFAIIAAIAASLVLVACGRDEPPKPSTTAKPLSSSTTAAKTETKKEEAPHAPDLHGMPGMADLFKGEEKPVVKASEKPVEKPVEKK